jgi:hypothetical protein
MPNNVATLQYSGSTTILGAVQMETYAVGGAGQASAVFEYNNALYQVLQWVGSNVGGGGSINVFRSTDGGATWSILDQANSPNAKTDTTPSAAVFYDGANTLTVASTAGSPITPASAAIQLNDFNLTTGKWGAAYGAGSSVVFAVSQLYKRSDGSILVIALSNASGSNITANVFAAGAWSQFSLVGLLTAGWSANGSSSTVYDPATGAIHEFGKAFDAVPNPHIYYQRINLNNTVIGFQDLTGLTNNNMTAMGDPIIVSGQLLWGVLDPTGKIPGILVGVPLNAPVFTLSTGIDPNLLNTATAPTLVFDGTTLAAIYILQDNLGDQQLRIATTQTVKPPAKWVPGIVFDNNVAATPLPNMQYPTLGLVGGNSLFATVQSGTVQPTNYFGSFSFVLPGPAAPTVGGANPGPSFTISPVGIGYAILPDPHIHCDVNGQKRCIVMKRSKLARPKVDAKEY